jgi:hypothetical protein
MLIPSKIIFGKFHESLYDLATGPTKGVRDITDPALGVHLSGFIKACYEKELPPLNLTSISTLFTSCCGAYPIGWKKHFDYENSSQYRDLNFVWKDFTERVHFAYRIWSFKEDRQRVQSALQEFQDLHFAVEPVARAYQNLTTIFLSRYGAWKSDVTPVESDAPRMLVEAYRWHRAGVEKGWDAGRFPKVCLVNRASLADAPVPLLDTATMTIERDGRKIMLPTHSRADGRESQEMTAWRRNVEPLLLSGGRETSSQLALIAPEYIR